MSTRGGAVEYDGIRARSLDILSLPGEEYRRLMEGLYIRPPLIGSKVSILSHPTADGCNCELQRKMPSQT